MDSMLCEVYNAESAVIIPGSGTYGMEAVARQFATGKTAMALRNGYFSWRWTDIFETCHIPASEVGGLPMCILLFRLLHLLDLFHWFHPFPLLAK